MKWGWLHIFYLACYFNIVKNIPINITYRNNESVISDSFKCRHQYYIFASKSGNDAFHWQWSTPKICDNGHFWWPSNLINSAKYHQWSIIADGIIIATLSLGIPPKLWNHPWSIIADGIITGRLSLGIPPPLQTLGSAMINHCWWHYHWQTFTGSSS